MPDRIVTLTRRVIGLRVMPGPRKQPAMPGPMPYDRMPGPPLEGMPGPPRPKSLPLLVRVPAG